MIHKLTANKPSFHTVEFTPGLNVVIAERTKEATRKDTRNGLGKSTLIEIIDFCLGSQHASGKGLCVEALKDWGFTLEITVAGNRVAVTRWVESANRIVVDGPTDGWIEQPDEDTDTGKQYFNLARWRTVLGWAMFDLHLSYDAFRYHPSYRSLISYLVRRGAEAYMDPFKHFRQQATWDMQLHVAYLLGLNWELASRWQELRDEEEMIETLERAVKSGAFATMTGTVGELEAERVQMEAKIKQDHAALACFRVHPQYEEIQKQADLLTQKIHDVTNANISDRRRLTRYMEAVSEEIPPGELELERVYEEAALTFGETVKRTLEDAKEFHRRVVQNRKSFLHDEIEKLRRIIEDRTGQAKALMEERSQALSVLESHGALQEYAELQARLAAAKGGLERVSSQIADIKRISSRKRDIRVARVDLSKEAERDHEDRRPIWSEAVRLFNQHSEALYESPGSLVINIGESGYRFDVDIQRSGSEGIGKMKIFCFDLTLCQLQQRQPHGVDYLIHDSVVFDGVDSRQRALALQRAAAVAKEHALQYICTLNSDMIPMADFAPDFDFQGHVRMTLTDRDASGSLLGIRFQRPKRGGEETKS